MDLIRTLKPLYRGVNVRLLFPVEVKAENNRSKSLRTMIDREIYKDIRWGVKLVNGNVGFENGILTLPQWCAFKIREIVREFKP